MDLTGKTAIVPVAGGARRAERIRPLHVNLDEIVIKAIAQSSGSHVVRRST